MKNKSWFTLVEILIWITISVILMTSVSLFIVNWLSNITTQKKIIENYHSFNDFYSKLNDIFSTKNIDYIDISSSSWFLVKRWWIFWEWNFSYVWLTTQTWFCESSTWITKHLVIWNFSPFERSSYDIFSSLAFSWWTTSFSSDNYLSDTSNHYIYKNWSVVVWNGVFGSDIWLTWTSSYLNNPTWITFWSWKLFISDTLNNRILYLSWNTLSTLLDISDWIYNPTWILFESWTLYIVNAWKKEILSYFSTWSVPLTKRLDFTLNSSISPLNSIVFDFKNAAWTSITMSTPTASWSFSFSWITKNSWDFVTTWSNITYNFSWATSLNSWSYSVNLLNLSWNFSTNTNYYIEMTLSWTSSRQKFYFPFLTKWTWDITIDKSQNTLVSLTWWLNYPTWIFKSWNNLRVNDFLDRKTYEITSTWMYVWQTNLSAFNFNNFVFPDKQKTISNFVVDNFSYNYSSWILNLKVDYYKNYDCFNESNNILRTFILKSNAK